MLSSHTTKLLEFGRMLKSEKILFATTMLATTLVGGAYMLTLQANEQIETIKYVSPIVNKNPFSPVLVNIRQFEKTTRTEEPHAARETFRAVVASIPKPPHKPKFKQAYEITEHAVYLPDGTKLEAHSGLGHMRDNPQFQHVRMRGPTPVHTYNLSWREHPFHGVKAIRLTPQGGERSIYNRDGLLAHTYMLNPQGASNGCVSFRDYTPFQRAFERGEIRQLAVVP